LRKIRLLFAAFALVGTALAVGLSPVMAQEVEQEDVEQERVIEDEGAQDEVAPAEGLAPDIVVLFDEEDNPFYCLSVDANADGVSELLCVPQTATDDTATLQTTTDDTATDEEEAAEEEAAEEAAEDDE